MADAKIVVDLKACMRASKTSAQRTACETVFKQAGGTVTPDGGKVFTAPDGSAAFVTNGGKVF
jgi:hypothetical protein